jgi:hypothetical protein
MTHARDNNYFFFFKNTKSIDLFESPKCRSEYGYCRNEVLIWSGLLRTGTSGRIGVEAYSNVKSSPFPCSFSM